LTTKRKTGAATSSSIRMHYVLMHARRRKPIANQSHLGEDKSDP